MQTNPAAGREPESERELVISRVFDAPARLLFLAYSKPEHIRRWFGPRQWPVTSAEMDFRVGGRFRFQMTGPGGEKGPFFGGEYLEIVPDERLVFTDAFEGSDEKLTMFVTFHERGATTTLTMRVLFDSAAMKQKHLEMGLEQGVGETLDLLGELLAELSTAAA